MTTTLKDFILENPTLMVDLLNSSVRWEILDKFMLDNPMFFTWVEYTYNMIINENKIINYTSLAINSLLPLSIYINTLYALKSFYTMGFNPYEHIIDPVSFRVLYRWGSKIDDFSLYKLDLLRIYMIDNLISVYLNSGSVNNQLSNKIADYILLQIAEGNVSIEFMEFLSIYIVK